MKTCHTSTNHSDAACRLHPVKEVGIAGIRNFASVKCLHCHYAHYLARPEHKNIIGQWVHEMLMEKGLITV